MAIHKPSKMQKEEPLASPSKNINYVFCNGLRLIFCLVILVIVIILSYLWLPAKTHYHITESFQFSGAREDTVVNFVVLVPKSSFYQETKNLKISWGGSYDIESANNLDVIKIYLGLMRGERVEIVIEYDVVLPQGRISWNAPVESVHILPQKGIESDHPVILEQASRIINGTNDKDANAIYSFTTDYLIYSTEFQDCTSSSALKTYQLGSCVCAGYSRLMVALCRAAGIPAKMVVGVILPDPMFYDPDKLKSTLDNCGEAHAWVEYYSEGSWTMADPTWGSRYISYRQINRNDGRHISFGDYDTLVNEWENLNHWAMGSQTPVFEAGKFPYYLAISPNKISFSPEILIQKRWDGRYLNVFLSWAVVTFLSHKFRHKLITEKNDH